MRSFLHLISLFLPTYQAKSSKTRFCCSDTKAAVISNSVLFVYQIRNHDFIFDFSLQIPTDISPYIRLNTSPYCMEEMIAAYSNSSISFISLQRREIVKTLNRSFKIFVWDPTLPSAFYAVTGQKTFLHCIINESGIGTDLQEEVPDNIVRVIIAPTAPNLVFCLTSTGNVRHYRRGFPGKKPKFIHEFSLTDSDPIIELAPTYDDSVLLVTSHSISFYNIQTLKVSTVVNTRQNASTFVIVVCHPNFPDWIFGLMDNGKVHSWHFENNKYVASPHRFEFENHGLEYVRAFYAQDDEFAFLTLDCICIVSFYRQRFFVSKYIEIPRVKQDTTPQISDGKLCFVNSKGNLEIRDYQLNILSYIRQKEISSFAFNHNHLVWISRNRQIYHFHDHKATCIYSSNHLNADLTELRVRSNLVTAQVGPNRIVTVLDGKDINYFYFPSIFGFLIFESAQKYKFILAVGVASKEVQFWTFDHHYLFSFTCPFDTISAIFEFNEELHIVHKSGAISIIQNEKSKFIKIPVHIAAKYDGEKLVLKTEKQILFFDPKTAEKSYVTFDVASPLLSFDSERFLVFDLCFHLIPISPPLANNTTEENFSPKLPSTFYLEKDFLRHHFERAVYLFGTSLPLPIPDEVYWIRYFLRMPQTVLPAVNSNLTSQIIFMSLFGMKLTGDQVSSFESCAKVWEHQSRNISAAIMFDFIGKKADCFRNLLEIKKLELALWYAQENELEEQIVVAAKALAEFKDKGGDFLLASAILMKFGQDPLARIYFERGCNQRGIAASLSSTTF